jgi:hypothetical protein
MILFGILSTTVLLSVAFLIGMRFAGQQTNTQIYRLTVALRRCEDRAEISDHTIDYLRGEVKRWKWAAMTRVPPIVAKDR